MRLLLTALAGLFVSTTLVGCGASATIPQPPAQPTMLPPGTSPEMAKVKKSGGFGGGVAPAKPAPKK